MPKETNNTQNETLFMLFPQCSHSNSYLSKNCASIPFSGNFLFLIYSLPLYILTPPSLSNQILITTPVPLNICWRWQNKLLSYELYCSSYFLINAVDKTVAHHLMRRELATSRWKLPLLSVTFSPLPILPT